MKETLTLDINELKFKGIDDNFFDEETTLNLRRQIANTIFSAARSIPVHEASKLMYKGEPAEITSESVNEIKQIVEDNAFKLFVQIPLIELLNNLK